MVLALSSLILEFVCNQVTDIYNVKNCKSVVPKCYLTFDRHKYSLWENISQQMWLRNVTYPRNDEILNMMFEKHNASNMCLPYYFYGIEHYIKALYKQVEKGKNFVINGLLNQYFNPSISH